MAREMTAMRRLSRYLKEKHPEIESCQDISRAIVEDYLTYLNTESLQTKEFRSELNRLRSVLEMVGKLYHYEQLDNIILNRDIPPFTRAEFKTYSDAELRERCYSQEFEFLYLPDNNTDCSNKAGYHAYFQPGNQSETERMADGLPSFP